MKSSLTPSDKPHMYVEFRNYFVKEDRNISKHKLIYSNLGNNVNLLLNLKYWFAMIKKNYIRIGRKFSWDDLYQVSFVINSIYFQENDLSSLMSALQLKAAQEDQAQLRHKSGIDPNGMLLKSIDAVYNKSNIIKILKRIILNKWKGQ